MCNYVPVYTNADNSELKRNSAVRYSDTWRFFQITIDEVQVRNSSAMCEAIMNSFASNSKKAMYHTEKPMILSCKTRDMLSFALEQFSFAA